MGKVRSEWISLTDRAYAVGVIDSDGWVSVRRGATTGGGYTYAPSVAVSLKFDTVPRWFEFTFGVGTVSKREQSRKGFPPMWTWSAHCRNAAFVLELLLPYLLIKKDRAEAAISLAHTARNRGKNWKDRLFITPEEFADRARLAQIIRDDNMRSNARVAKWAKDIYEAV